MNIALSNFATRLRELISQFPSPVSSQQFEVLALELFGLQFQHNPVYRTICLARGHTPENVKDWTQIPAVPTSAFKELELTSLPPGQRSAVFHSSGTTEQKPSRHFHGAESLELYEASLWSWFQQNCEWPMANGELVSLTPPPEQAPNSSLVHMFETVWQKSDGMSHSPYVGSVQKDGAWTLDFDRLMEALGKGAGDDDSGSQAANLGPCFLLGTAFSFVHLLDYLAERDLQLQLPAGSRVMETGGYKNRSRTMPKVELHTLITQRLGVTRENIICEYGMSELSSQAYDTERHSQSSILHPRVFRFPPWARVQIVSPETGLEVADGETGLIRIFDLANVFSVAAIQTEDLGIRRGDGFELAGRAQLAEPRGCSLMTA